MHSSHMPPAPRTCVCAVCMCAVQEAAAAVSHVTASAGDVQALQALMTQQYRPADELPSVLVVDPPRKGLDPAVLELLLLPPQQADADGSSSSSEGTLGSVNRLVYLSCGFDALRRDVDALLAGGWRVSAAQGFLFFPGTDTIETLVVFDR